MSELNITVNVDELIGANKYYVDEENAHIKLDQDNLDDVDDVEFQKLVRICPAALYKTNAEGHKSFDYAGCLECGTCRICCEETIISKWDMPQPGRGILYRFG